MTDYPLSLPGAHGRIDAYRLALAKADEALQDAYPYVNGVGLDHSNAPWRIDTAKATLETIRAARERIAGELAVTNP